MLCTRMSVASLVNPGLSTYCGCLRETATNRQKNFAAPREFVRLNSPVRSLAASHGAEQNPGPGGLAAPVMMSASAFRLAPTKKRIRPLGAVRSIKMEMGIERTAFKPKSLSWPGHPGPRGARPECRLNPGHPSRRTRWMIVRRAVNAATVRSCCGHPFLSTSNAFVAHGIAEPWMAGITTRP